jgi:hypothetical protein
MYTADFTLSSQLQALCTRYRHKMVPLLWIQQTDVRSLRSHIPPLPEQRRIVTYLDDLQAKVDALKQLQAETQAELDSLLPSILDKAFKGELV